ncbi:hypothetical protein BU15DRAFT_76400 [Melanogaster broomeanus]|nr:hypothetical protein BU15DRAFT_76400 [Melanogaster broomeanus]
MTSPLYRHPALQVPMPAHSHSGPTDSIDRGGSITDGDDHLWTGDQTTVAVVLGKRLHEDSDADVELCAETHSEAGMDALSHASDHDEEELDTVISSLSTGVSLLREAADRLESQLVHRNRLWMKNIATSSWLKGVERFVKDTNHVEVTGHQQAETKRSRHVMGYHARYRSVAGSELHSGSEDEVESVARDLASDMGGRIAFPVVAGNGGPASLLFLFLLLNASDDSKGLVRANINTSSQSHLETCWEGLAVLLCGSQPGSSQQRVMPTPNPKVAGVAREAAIEISDNEPGMRPAAKTTYVLMIKYLLALLREP